MNEQNHPTTGIRQASTHWTLLATSLLTLTANQALLAGGFRLPDQDAFATARGEAFAATADNASAIYYNPAGLGQLRGHNIRSGFYSIWFQSSYEDAGGQDWETDAKINPVPQLFYAYGCEDLPLTFGLGIYAPFGLSLKWPQDVPFRQVALEGSLTYMTVNPAVAWRIAPNLSLGVGLNINRGQALLKQGLAPIPLGDEFKFKGDGMSVGGNVGLQWQINSNFTVGATYRSPSTIDMDGDIRIIPPASTPSYASASLDFNIPQSAVVGVSWRPNPKWNIEVNVEWTDWNNIDSLAIQSVVPLPAVPFNWHASYYYELGATRYFENGWHVSGGYVFNQSAMPDRFYNPVVADVDKHFLSVGTGHRGKRWSFDVAYQFGYGPQHTVQGSTLADGKYDFVSHALSTTVGYHF